MLLEPTETLFGKCARCQHDRLVVIVYLDDLADWGGEMEPGPPAECGVAHLGTFEMVCRSCLWSEIEAGQRAALHGYSRESRDIFAGASR